MLTAFDLDPEKRPNASMKRIYEKAGMKRDCHLLSLREGRSLKAVFVVNISDAGLNMSNLTNCVTAFVLDREGLAPESFMDACNEVLAFYREEEVPVLVHPVSYEEKMGRSGGKIYTLWAFSIQYLDLYLDYISRLTKRHGPHAD